MSHPSSTYRIQLRPDFGFDDVARIAPYLAALGVTHVYLSPYLQAESGSTHGYDIVDHSQVNQELGGVEAHLRMCEALRSSGLGQIADVVPNHMAISSRKNKWWWDVLKHGENSRYANYFDIDWSLIDHDTGGRLLLPVLGSRYGDALASGELSVRLVDGEPVVAYFDSEYPLANVDADDVEPINADIYRLDQVLEHQHYRLAYWRLSAEELEYRRFFDINSLMALNSQRDEVFAATHGLIERWRQDGLIDGLRIDHVDGLVDPAQYLQRIRALATDGYIAVEKILQPGERLRASWPIQGTTGYDALRLIDGLFIDPTNGESFDQIYREFSGYEASWPQTVHECKGTVIDQLFGSDVARLVDGLKKVCEFYPEVRDFSQHELTLVVKALLSSLTTYRTYVVPETGYVAETDEQIIREAAGRAKDLLADLDPLIDFVVEVLTLRQEGAAEADFTRRFQQVSGPVMAKGVEDTAGYRYNRLVVLNEVGGAADRFGVRPDEFHEACADAQRSWPERMVAATTHDTKRSEDFRYRLALISENPDAWRAAIERWAKINEKHGQNNWPDKNTEYLLYQTLVGSYPIEQNRLTDYVIKAVREARIITSWQANNEVYENALRWFVAGIYSDTEFQDALNEFVEPLIPLGRINALAATVVRLTMPGIPDIFQGSELWNHSLVDPDNRRRVDYQARQNLLEQLDALATLPLIDDSGMAKLFVIRKLLTLRNTQPQNFDHRADYLPLVSKGERAANVVAYQRGNVVIVVPRLVWSLNGDWMDTVIDLPSGQWQDVFTNSRFNGSVPLADLFQMFPVSVLTQNEANG